MPDMPMPPMPTKWMGPRSRGSFILCLLDENSADATTMSATLGGVENAALLAAAARFATLRDRRAAQQIRQLFNGEQLPVDDLDRAGAPASALAAWSGVEREAGTARGWPAGRWHASSATVERRNAIDQMRRADTLRQVGEERRDLRRRKPIPP